MLRNIPAASVYVRNEFLYDQQKGHGEYTQGWIFAVRSVKGLALQFFCLLETGAMFTGLPIHAFSTNKKGSSKPLGVHQMWDNLSNDIDVVQLDFIKGMGCKVILRDKTVAEGSYLFTIDYNHKDPNIPNTGLTHTPNEWKSAHIVELEDGNLIAYPPNRILFMDASLVDPSQDPSKLGYKVNTRTWACEDGKKWHVGDSDEFFYRDSSEDAE